MAGGVATSPGSVDSCVRIVLTSMLKFRWQQSPLRHHPDRNPAGARPSDLCIDMRAPSAFAPLDPGFTWQGRPVNPSGLIHRRNFGCDQYSACQCDGVRLEHPERLWQPCRYRKSGCKPGGCIGSVKVPGHDLRLDLLHHRLSIGQRQFPSDDFHQVQFCFGIKTIHEGIQLLFLDVMKKCASHRRDGCIDELRRVGPPQRTQAISGRSTNRRLRRPIPTNASS